MSSLGIDWSSAGLQLVEPKYSLLSSASLLYYDYLLTFPSEVQLIWRCRWNPATGFFLAIRYGALLIVTLGVAHVFYQGSSASPSMTARSCQAITDVILVINAIHFAIISAFVSLRISAIWSRNLYLGVILFLLGLLNPSVITPMLLFGFQALPGPPTLVACVSYLPQDSNPLGPLVLRYFPIVSSAVGIVYELICLLLTAAKTFSLYREQQKIGTSTRLTAILLHDGSLYFAVLTMLAVITIVAASIPPGSLPADMQVDTDIARALTPILVTRFILDLRAIDHVEGERPLTGSMPGRLSTVRFENPAVVACARHSSSVPLAYDSDSNFVPIEDSQTRQDVRHHDTSASCNGSCIVQRC